MPTADRTPKGGRTVDLSIGEMAEVALAGGKTRRIKLLSVHEPRCAVRGVIRFPKVTLDVDGERADVPAALYHMPQVVNGVRIGCSVTGGVAEDAERKQECYALDKDARIRCWPADGPLFDKTPLVYPARQRWFASMTQMANERTYVDAGELPLNRPDAAIYHHWGMDIGGHDRAVPIVAARAGTVVVRGEQTTPDFADAAGVPRYDRVVVRDEDGWDFLYSHLDMIAPTVRLGAPIEAGAPVGALGKEGSSGGWAHLHFGIKCIQPSGRPGQVEGYPFLVEAYLNEHPGALLACARPHRAAGVGEEIELDGSRSICDGGKITSYRWTLHNRETVDGVRVKVSYDREGMYSEMLTVTDDRGQTDVDFCVVQILPQDGDPAKTPPTMHLTYYPTENIRPGQPIAFKARTFFKGAFAVNQGGEELWDFGDGTTATTCSGAPGRGTACAEKDFDERWHAYDKPGRYIVTVRRTGTNGLTATAQLKVEVEEPN
ncbi:MAG: PKD domain-containing protein [Planctomycetota bacterium]